MTVTDVFAQLAEGTEWHSRAACQPGCLPVGSDCWFVQPAPSPKGRLARRWSQEDIRNAIRVCQSCPVRDECGDWARRHDVPFGVWGGQVVGHL